MIGDSEVHTVAFENSRRLCHHGMLFAWYRQAIDNGANAHIAEVLIALHARVEQDRPPDRVVAAENPDPNEPLVLRRIKNIQNFGISDGGNRVMVMALIPDIVGPAPELQERLR